MVKRLHYFILALVALWACREEDPWLNNVGQKESIGAYASLKDFKPLYEASLQSSDLRSLSLEHRSIDTDLSLIDAKPLWGSAQVSFVRDSLRFVTIPVEARLAALPISETLSEEETVRYKEKLSYLFLVRRDVKDDPERMTMFYQYFRPSLKWLQGGGSFDNDYQVLPRGYDGEVDIYTLSGHAVQRLLYQNGRLKAIYQKVSKPMEARAVVVDTICTERLVGRIKYEGGTVIPFTEDYLEECEAYIDSKKVPGGMPVRFVRNLDIYEMVCFTQRRHEDSQEEWEQVVYDPTARAQEEAQRVSEDLQPPRNDTYGSGNSYWQNQDKTTTKNIKYLLDKGVRDRISGKLIGFNETTVKRLNQSFVDIDRVPSYKRLDKFFIRQQIGFKHIVYRYPPPSKKYENTIAALKGDTLFIYVDLAEPESFLFSPRTIIHELIHLYQYELYRMGERTKAQRELLMGYREFEVALIQDIIYMVETKDNIYLWDHYLYPIKAIPKGNYSKEYDSWLKELTQNGTRYPSEIDVEKFKEFARKFGETTANYSIKKGYRYDKNVPYDTRVITSICNELRQ